MRKAKSQRKTGSGSRHSASRTNGASPKRAPNAITLLRADHAKVQQLFKDFEKANGKAKKSALAQTICSELTVHTKIEEEIFYPAAREALDETDLLNEADVEHASAKELIAQIEDGSPDDDHWDAKVTVLGEYINHHVKEEQNELFPKVRKSDIDLNALGEQLQARKKELAPQMSKRNALPSALEVGMPI